MRRPTCATCALASATGAPPIAASTCRCRLKLIDEKDFTHEGRIDFVDNAIDRSSGTIRGRAEFANADGTLTPGMFGRIQIAAVARRPRRCSCPTRRSAPSRCASSCSWSTATTSPTPKYVTLGPVVDGLRVVTAGLDADDRVIVNGLMRVRPGAKVTPQQAPQRGRRRRARHRRRIRTN